MLDIPESKESVYGGVTLLTACRDELPKKHTKHTLGPECRHAIPIERQSAPRTGQHPRPPRVRTQDSVTAHEQAQDLDGTDMGS